jgi:lipopolysaccharide/colanic/teichoic acid biosynthesis glycosyltransferase
MRQEVFMSRIDLAMAIHPARGSNAAAVHRSIRIWLCLLLLVCDMIALMTGLSAGLAFAPVAITLGDVSPSLGAITLAYAIVAFHNQAYDPRILRSATMSCRNAGRAFAGTILLFFLLLFAVKSASEFPRLALLAGLGSAGGLLLIQRLVLSRLIDRYIGDRLFAELMIVDDCPIPNDQGPMALVDAQAAGLRADLDDPYMLHRLGMLLRDHDRVVVACPEDRRIIWAQMLKGGNIVGEVISPEVEAMAPLAVGRWRDAATLVVARGPLNLANRATKRLLDLAVTVPLLIGLAPLMLIVALAIKLESPGPIFFRQQRIGRANTLFSIFKFRSMKADQCDAQGHRSASRADDRVTQVGRFIRRTSIDELPQLINVLLGDMSLVGPRPHAIGSTAENIPFWRVDQQYWKRHALKPGITGLAQIRGFRGATETRDDILKRVEADLEYMNDWSLVRDIVILAGTIQILVHKNAF